MFLRHDGKGAVLAVLLFVFLASCNQTQYQTGDLIFVEGSAESTMDQAIMGSTGKMVHVGIVEVKGDSVFVIDAGPKTGISRRITCKCQKYFVTLSAKRICSFLIAP